MTRKAWTDSEVEYLRNSASESFLRDLATHLDRPEKMVRWKLGKLGLKAKDGRMSGLGGAPTTVWSEERMEYLQEHAQLLSARQIAENLGLTEKQIRHALNYFGIPGRGKGAAWTEESLAQKAETIRRKRAEKYPEEGPWPCSTCGVLKPLTEFSDSSKAGKHRSCRLCIRQRNLMRAYGLTLEQYDAMFESQGGVCGICKHPETRLRKDGELFALAVDHDHSCCPGKRTCGKCVRGLLCWECNNILGKIEKREGMLEGIASYLA